jgi:hypothetical protein
LEENRPRGDITELCIEHWYTYELLEATGDNWLHEKIYARGGGSLLKCLGTNMCRPMTEA